MLNSLRAANVTAGAFWSRAFLFSTAEGQRKRAKEEAVLWPVDFTFPSNLQIHIIFYKAIIEDNFIKLNLSKNKIM